MQVVNNPGSDVTHKFEKNGDILTYLRDNRHEWDIRKQLFVCLASLNGIGTGKMLKAEFTQSYTINDTVLLKFTLTCIANHNTSYSEYYNIDFGIEGYDNNLEDETPYLGYLVSEYANNMCEFVKLNLEHSYYKLLNLESL